MRRKKKSAGTASAPAQNAAAQVMGAVGSPVQQMRDELLGMVAHFHAVVDFPDEDIDPVLFEDAAALLEAVETAQNANVHLSIDFYGGECREGEGLGANPNDTYKGTVLANGEKVTDFSAESGDAEVCAVSVKNGQLIFKTGKNGVTYILVTWQGHTARFEWCTE